jgi:hypothetical protein
MIGPAHNFKCTNSVKAISSCLSTVLYGKSVLSPMFSRNDEVSQRWIAELGFRNTKVSGFIPV